MTPEPEMTLEIAKEIVAKECGGYPCDESMIHNYAWGIIAGHAAGLKESQALVKELGWALNKAKGFIPTGYVEYHRIFDDALESARRMA